MKKLNLIYLISITIIAGAILASSKASADDSVVSQVSISVPTTCTMNGTGMNSHTANVNNGTYTPDIGTTTLHAFCNDANGFAIYAVGYTDNEFGKNVLTNSTLGASHDISTGTAESGNTSNWAMKLAKTQDSGDTTSTNAFTLDNGFNSYHAVPAEYTKVAHKNTATDMDSTTGGVKLTTTYAVLISANQAAGTYTGQVKYTLVHPASEIPTQPQPAVAGYIVYHPNGNNVIGTMANQPANDNSAITLYPSNFSREGYGFAGWSTTYDYSDSTGFYGPMETITAPTDVSTNGLSLYAIWVKSAGTMQNWTGCNSLTSGSVTALTDQRDNDTYAVAKLTDGNCWMIENLRLDNTASHNSDGTLAQGYGTSMEYGNFSGLANPESPWITGTDFTTPNSLYSIDGSNNTVNIGTFEAANRFPRYNNQNTTSRANTTTNYTNIYSFGNYYTWHAAIADLTPNNTINNSTTSSSLCPSAWHLPTGGLAYASGNDGGINVTGDPTTFRDYYKLGYAIMDERAAYENAPYHESYYSDSITNDSGDTASMAFRKYPNNFIYSGFVNSGSIYNRGTLGLYWSSTAYDNNEYYITSFKLQLNDSRVYPATNGTNKFNGITIRCIISES